MKERSFILPNSESLSCEATGLLSTMLNHPESDYHTAEELCTFFKRDSLSAIRQALDELAHYGYVIEVSGSRYAINKKRILEMKIYMFVENITLL